MHGAPQRTQIPGLPQRLIHLDADMEAAALRPAIHHVAQVQLIVLIDADRLRHPQGLAQQNPQAAS